MEEALLVERPGVGGVGEAGQGVKRREDGEGKSERREKEVWRGKE